MNRLFEREEDMFHLDTNVWELTSYNSEQCVRLKKGYIGQIDLPAGLLSCYSMFADMDIPEGCYLGNFDTSQVKDMSHMFYNATMPQGFGLDKVLSTRSVEDMSSMFAFATLPDDFELGDNFYTSRVRDMANMFAGTVLPSGFKLGEGFDTARVDCLAGAFTACDLSKCSELAPLIVIRERAAANKMFYGAKLSFDIVNLQKFTIGETADVTDFLTEAKVDDYWLSDMFKTEFRGTNVTINTQLNDSVSTSEQKYDFNRLYDIPKASVINCETLEELMDKIKEYCKV